MLCRVSAFHSCYMRWCSAREQVLMIDKLNMTSGRHLESVGDIIVKLEAFRPLLG